MRQTPVYVLNHSKHNFRKRSTQEDLDEIEDWTDRAAKRMYEGAGLGPNDVDIFNPYDGYAPMAQFFLERLEVATPSAKVLEQLGSFDLGDHRLYFRERDRAMLQGHIVFAWALHVASHFPIGNCEIL